MGMSLRATRGAQRWNCRRATRGGGSLRADLPLGGRWYSAGMAVARGSIVIEPATPERWADVRAVLDGDAEKGCWCQAWRGLDATAYSGGRSRPELLREQMGGGPPPPGYLAYLDGQPVGWVGVGVRNALPRLAASRTIPAIDDRPVWAIGCFRIRPGFRRRGVARALLDGVVAAARTAGAPGVEAYPIDPHGARVEVGAGFVGFASMFDAAGFRRVLVTAAHSGHLPRLLVRLDL